jgi:hypothetical protein
MEEEASLLESDSDFQAIAAHFFPLALVPRA